MGTYTNAEIVKNAAYVGEITERFEAELSEEDFEKFEDDGLEKGFAYRGWTLTNPCKDHGRIFADEFQKGEHTVYLINTSQYALVGEEEYVVFGENRAAVEAFLKDWGINEDISDQDAITQTL